MWFCWLPHRRRYVSSTTVTEKLREITADYKKRGKRENLQLWTPVLRSKTRLKRRNKTVKKKEQFFKRTTWNTLSSYDFESISLRWREFRTSSCQLQALKHLIFHRFKQCTTRQSLSHPSKRRMWQPKEHSTHEQEEGVFHFSWTLQRSMWFM